MASFAPSTVPGCRAPHFWLDGGRSFYDELGPAYTLLVRDSGIDSSSFLQAAEAARLPIKVLDISAEKALPEIYRHALLICRSDQHVVWRADAWPVQCEALVGLLRGALSC